MENLNRRKFLKAASVISISGILSNKLKASQKISEKQRRPNVLFLFSDQHQASVMGYENHPDVLTPNIDKLAASGTVFKRAYCQDGICMPSRMSITSGLYPRTLGSLHNCDRTKVMDEVVSLQSLFKKKGYYTAAFGKRHLKSAADKGWDIHKSHLQHESPGNSYVEWIKDKGHYDEYLKDWGSEHGGKYPTADLATRISALPEDETFEAFTANETIKLIKEQKNRDKPFYCWSTFYRPHQPYNAQKRFLDLYKYDKWGEGTLKGDSIKKPSTLNQPAESLPPALKNWREGANKVWCLDKAAKDEQLYRFYIASYYALVSEIDHHIGRIIQALEEEGLLENTIIVYASDHGDFVGGHGMVEKCAIGHNVYEETLRVPYIVSYPGVVKKQTCNDLVELFSIYPTLCDLAKIDLPKSKHPTAAVSVVDTLTEEKPVGEKFVVSENWSQATVITDRYKLGIWLDPKKIPGYDRSPLRQHYGDIRDFGDMLFDRKKDPHEVNNLIDDPDYKEIAKHLYACYEKFDSNVPRIEFK